jgi:His-Xaa-Ser system protein HxsD
MRFTLDEESNEVAFDFDTKVYRREALYGTGLVFTDRAFVYVQRRGAGRLTVTLQGKKPLTAGQLNEVAGEFHNELLNQSLRWLVARHNRRTKEAIQTQALISARTAEPAKRKARPKAARTARR